MNKSFLKGAGAAAAALGILSLTQKPKTRKNPSKGFVTGLANYTITSDVLKEDENGEFDHIDQDIIKARVNIESKKELDKIILEMIELTDGAWSSYPLTAKDVVNEGVYFAGLYDENLKTGVKTYYAYHFHDISMEEAQYILESLDF